MTYGMYKNKCRERWHGVALNDAISNWSLWKEWREYLVEAMNRFLHNPYQKDLGGKCHNPEGSLYQFLWNCQAAIQPDNRRLDPFLDFEEHYQKIFLRRGLLIYCEDLIDEIKYRPSPQEESLFDKTKDFQ
jgi:hypothetical protein